MLIGNYSVLNKTPGRFFSGSSVSCNRSNWNTSGPQRNIYIGWALIAYFNGKPFGYDGEEAYMIPQKSGGMAIVNGATGSGNVSFANLAAGLNAVSSISGSGDITNAAGQLIVSAVATIVGTGGLSADIVGKLEASATLANSGDLVASLGALASAVSTIVGSSTLDLVAYAHGDMSATISSSSTLSPESLASAVWNAIATTFNTAGTMGAKLNGAASAGDPWSTALPGSYISGQAGNILAQIQALVDELHKIEGLDAASPMTVTPDSRTAGTIDLSITGDGETSTTVTRQ